MDTVSRLKSRTWFQASFREVQEKLLSLPREGKQDCSGFLEHLANRPDEGGGVRVLSIESVLFPSTPIFGIFINIKVQKIDNPDAQFCYQYFSWRQGPSSGAKGLILVENEGRVTHLVFQRGFSFAVGGDTFDCAGGFAEANEKSMNDMLARFKTEIREELGVETVKLLRVIDLGRMHPDRGMTPNCPNVFAAVIDGSTAAQINEGGHVNPDAYEMQSGPVIVPVEQLWGENGLAMRNTDAYFQTGCFRLTALGLLKPPG
jgi:hypothetical protein